MSTSSSSYSWVKALPRTLLAVDDIPLVSHVPVFPWQAFVEKLIKRFELSSMSLAPSEWLWREPSQFFTGIAGTPFLLGIGIAGYEGQITLACDESALPHLMGELLHHPVEFDSVDLAYQHGFMRFLAADALDLLATLPWEKKAQGFLFAEASLSEQPQLTMDLTCELPNYTLKARLFLDDTFRNSWKEAHREPFDLSHNPALAQRLVLPASVQAGHTTFSLAQWQQIQPGDFFMLDHCGLEPDCHSGTLTLVIQHLPFFKAQLTNGELLLIEQATLDEVTTLMAKKPDDSEDDFEFDDDDFTLSGDDDAFDFDDEDLLDEPEELPTPAQQDTASAAAPPQTKAASQEVAATPQAAQHTEVEGQHAAKTASPKDIPLTVVVEVGRFEMTVEKLMTLQPGNLLSLNIHPENGVDLTVNGRRIGRGELLLFGESLGVRVTEV